MISWSVAIKTLSVGPYWRIMGRTIRYQVLLRFRIFRSIVFSHNPWWNAVGLISLIDLRSAVTSQGSIVSSVWRGRSRCCLSRMSLTTCLLMAPADRCVTLDAPLAIYNGDQKVVSGESRQLSPCHANWPVFFSDKWLVTSMRSLGFCCL